MSGPARTASGLLCAGLLATQVLAQGVPVTTPRLPPRSDGAAPSAPAVHTAAQPAATPGGAAAYTPQTAYAHPAPAPRAYAQPTTSQHAPQAAIVPARAVSGSCRVVLAPDRQSLTLVSGPEALPRQHLALGEFRAQQVVHSPDGRWALAFTKLRGAAQFAALSIDLERCEAQRSMALRAAGEDAVFDGDEAVLRSAGSEQRIGLRDGRVR